MGQAYVVRWARGGVKIAQWPPRERRYGAARPILSVCRRNC